MPPMTRPVSAGTRWPVTPIRSGGPAPPAIWPSPITAQQAAAAGVRLSDVQLDGVLENGAAFDGSSITGYAEIEESDIVAMPDWDTFKILPWSQNQEKTAFVFCDVLGRDFKPYEGDPRWVLRRQLQRAERMGLKIFVGPELEYFYFRNAERPEVIDQGGYFDVLPADLGNDLRKQTIRVLDKLGSPMEASHHEVAPSQHEFDPPYDEALTMADRLVVMSEGSVRQVGSQRDLYERPAARPRDRDRSRFGAQQLATGAVFADYLHLSCIHPLRPGDEAYANGLVIPIDTPEENIRAAREAVETLRV
jgi:hypothetical protein